MGNIKLKIFNGTRSDGRRLCDTYKFGLVTRGAAETEEHVYCSWMGRTVAMTVRECNRFDSTVDPTLEEMEGIALAVRGDSKRLKVGFSKPCAN